MRLFRTLAIIFVSLFTLSVTSPSLAETSPAALPDVQWTYQAETGPDFWGELNPEFATCTSGKSQSPIDLVGAEDADLLNPEFHYDPVPLNLLNNGHTVQVPYAPGSYIVLEGTRYNLLQFHFHSPSEHTVKGQQEIAELHLVHQNEAGELAVVAVLLHSHEQGNRDSREQASTTAYRDLIQNLPMQAGDKVRTDKSINAQSLLPQQTTTYRYSGSLTTPPCSESVTWLVMSQPISLPSEQLTPYEKLLNHNNRPLQSIHKRSIQLDTSL